MLVPNPSHCSLSYTLTTEHDLLNRPTRFLGSHLPFILSVPCRKSGIYRMMVSPRQASCQFVSAERRLRFT